MTDRTNSDAADSAGDPPRVGMAIKLRSAAFAAALGMWTGGLGMLVIWLLVPPEQLVRRPIRALIRFWARGVLLLVRLIAGVRWSCPDLEALDRLRDGGGRLLAVKHQSAWETIVFLALLPDCCYVLKRELLKIPFYGWFTARAGMIAIDRSARGAALKAMVNAARAALQDGRTIIIFPEGTRVTVGRHGPIHPGVLALQRELGVPILPVAHNSGLYWERFNKRPGEIVMRILPEIPPEPDRHAVASKLKAALFDTSDRLVEAARAGGPPAARTVDTQGSDSSASTDC